MILILFHHNDFCHKMFLFYRDSTLFVFGKKELLVWRDITALFLASNCFLCFFNFSLTFCFLFLKCLDYKRRVYVERNHFLKKSGGIEDLCVTYDRGGHNKENLVNENMGIWQ